MAVDPAVPIGIDPDKSYTVIIYVGPSLGPLQNAIWFLDAAVKQDDRE